MTKKDEISINFKDVNENIKKSYNATTNFLVQNKTLVTTILLIILMISAYNVRAQAYELGYADQIAENFVFNNYKSQIEEQVRAQNPALGSSAVRDRVNREFDVYYSNNRAQIRSEINQLSNQIKQNYIGPNGEPYILDLDSHYYWQLTRQYYETGMVYDTILEDGTMIDSFQLAPLGNVRSNQELHPIYTVWTHRLTSWLTGFSLYETFNKMPAIISMLVVIPAFFIGRLFGGNLAGFVGGLIMAMHPAYISRSVAGYSSTDGYNVLFPLLIIWFVLIAFKSTDLWKKVTFASLAGLLVGIFSRTWSAWWFIFVLVMISAIGYIAFIVLRKIVQNNYEHWSDFKEPGILTGTLILSSVFFATLFSGFQAVFLAPIRVFTGQTGLGIQDAVGQGLWPNVFTTVAELSRPSTMQIIANLGGGIIFIIAMVGIVLSLLPLRSWKRSEYLIFFGAIVFGFIATTTLPMDLAVNQGIDYSITFTALILIPILAGFVNLLFKKHEVNLVIAVFASVFFVASLFTSTQGVRFILLIVPALAIALSVAVGRLYHVTKHFFEKNNWNKQIGFIAIILAFTIILFPLVEAGQNTGFSRLPGISDGWFDSLTEIKETTDPDTILTSWWDFGHWFKTLAERRVTFDGASQNTPMAHWVGKALLTDDENKSVGILKMLACGSRTGFERLAENMHEVDSYSQISARQFLETYRALNEVILLEDNQAREFYLNLGLSEQGVEEVMNLTHCQAPPVIFITSNDMIGKAPVWGHFGAWDFERAYVASIARSSRSSQVAIEDISETLDVSNQRAQELYFSARTLRNEREVSDFISPRPSYLTSNPVNCVDEQSRVICQTNLGIGRGGGAVNVLSGIEVNKDNLSQSRLLITVIEEISNEVVTRTNIRPSGIIFNNSRVSFDNPDLNLDVIIEYRDGMPVALIASESLANSMFTRLYFFDGEGLDRFEKFSEHRNDFANHRIKNWNVLW